MPQKTNPLDRGHTVRMRTRKGTIDMAVIGYRYVTRGKYAGWVEVSYAPLQDVGKSYAFKLKCESDDPRLSTPPSQTYSDDEVRAAIAKSEGTRMDVDRKKNDRAERGRVALENIRPGMEVQVRYRDIGLRWEVVGDVNWKTGKVGIVKRGYREQVRRDRQAEDFGSYFGRPVKAPRRRKYRWLHPDIIADVRERQS